ncbi:MAG TPA: rRNA maturation RNase YbeY [Ilumatobacteraceae bacterium]|nr:rRNA maturation RNase YbeY [Ilumatobacteraceae bacterium]
MADPPSPTGVGSPIVVCANEQDDVDIDPARWTALAEAVLRAERASGELTLTFVDPAEIASLNAEHMGIDGPTDVLSFPLDAAGMNGGERHDGTPVLLGDVVVCPAIAAIAAPDHGGSVEDELALLVVHGILHVLGHDHAEPDETAAMRARERDLLSEYHWRGPAPAAFQQEQVEQEQREP